MIEVQVINTQPLVVEITTNSGISSSGVQSVTGVYVDNTDVRNPVVNVAPLEQRVEDLEEILSSQSNFTGYAYAVWTGTGLIFDVFYPAYYIQGTRYEADSGQVTLDAADPTYPRLDVIAVDATGPIAITGTAGVDPVKPTVDPLTQLEITTVLVAAGATTPTEITNEVVYSENAEWTGASNNGTVVFNSAADPFSGTVSVECDAFTDADYIRFTDGTTHSKTDFSVLMFGLKLKSLWSGGGVPTYIKAKFVNAGVAISDTVAVTSGSYNFSRTEVDNYQTIVIPISAFTFTSSLFDRIEFTFEGLNPDGFYLDYIVLQTGAATVSPLQNTLVSIETDSGTANADTPDDTFQLLGEDGLVTSASGKVVNVGLDYGATLNRIVNSMSMGLIEGGQLSINGGDNTKFDISAGKGIIIDNYTDPDIPVITEVSWGAYTAVTPTYLATNTVSHILIQSDGTVRQQTSYPTASEHRDYIYLGQLGHTNLTNIATALNRPETAIGPSDQLRDLQDFVGLVNSGNLVTANGANLKINKSEGYLHGTGINFHTDNTAPNTKYYAAAVAATLRLRTQTGNGSTGVTDIDPANYDVGGTITAIGGTKYTNQRIFLTVAGNIVIQYGQTLYNNLSQAIAGVNRESFVIFENLANNAFPICVLSVRNTATDLSDPAQANFSFPTKFGELNAAAAGISVSTLQNAYNNSTEPEILTDSTRGAVTIKQGSGADTDSVLEIANGVGTVVATITGEGNISVADEAYGAGWDGSTEVPTKNALYDKIETLGTGGGHTIQDDGTPLTQRTNLNFERFTVADDAGNDATVVTRPPTFTPSETEPSAPVAGDVWLDIGSTVWKLWVYYDSYWVELPLSGGGGGGTGGGDGVGGKLYLFNAY